METALILAVSACLFIIIQYGSIIFPRVKGLPVLMYHKVSDRTNDHLTISKQRLEKQFQYLSATGYTCLGLGQLVENKDFELPARCFVLTFDDAYLNNLQYLYPLLRKHGFHATIMLPVGFLGKTNAWDAENEPLMDYGQLLSMDRRFVSFGLHTFGHIPLHAAAHTEIKADIEKCRQELGFHGIKFLPVIAYPYGKYPKQKEMKGTFFNLLEQTGMEYGLRIGNRINKWPLKNRFEVKRIDIKGYEPFWKFKTKLKHGFVKRF